MISALNLNSLTLAIYRNAWKVKYRLFSIIMIAAFGVAVVVGTFSAISSLYKSSDYIQTRGNLSSLELRFSAEDVVNIPNFMQLPFVKDIQERIIYPGTLNISPNETLSALVIAPLNASKINTLSLLSGKNLDPSDKSGVLIERSLAEYHKIKVGDTLQLKLNKDVYTVHVRGIVTSPEFILTPANPSLFIPTKGSLGVIYAAPALISSNYGYQFTNSILFTLDKAVSLDSERSQILNLAKTRLNIDWSMTQAEQFVNQFLNKDLGIFKKIMPIIALISFLSSLVVTIFLLFQWIVELQSQIGIFMALGFSARSICYAFFKMFMWLAFISIGLGLFFSFGVLNGFVTQFAQSIGLSSVQLSLDGRYVLIASASVLAIFSVAGMVVINEIMKMTPRSAMVKEMPNMQGVSSLVTLSLPNIISSIWLRFSIRNLLRNPLISWMSIAALALGLGLATSFFITFSSFIGTSIKNVQRDNWDLVVDFSVPVWQENFSRYENIPGVSQIIPYTKGVVQVIQGDKRVNLYVGGIDPKRPMRVLSLQSGEHLSPGDGNSILLEKGVAAELGLTVGQSLTIESLGKQYNVILKGIFSGTLPGEAYLPIQFHREIADLTERATGLFVIVKGNENQVTNLFYAKPDVHSVLSKQQVIQQILQASGQVTQIITLGSAVNITIALLFIFASVTFTVMQRKQEYLTFRILGYSTRILCAMVLADIIILGLVAILFAIPIGYFIALYLNDALSVLWFQVDLMLTLKDYLVILIPGLVLMPLVAIPIICMLQNIPLNTMLKQR